MKGTEKNRQRGGRKTHEPGIVACRRPSFKKVFPKSSFRYIVFQKVSFGFGGGWWAWVEASNRWQMVSARAFIASKSCNTSSPTR